MLSLKMHEKKPKQKECVMSTLFASNMFQFNKDMIQAARSAAHSGQHQQERNPQKNNSTTPVPHWWCNSLGWWSASSFWNPLSCRTNRALLSPVCTQPPKPRDTQPGAGTARQRPSCSSISFVPTNKSPSLFPPVIQIIKKQWGKKKNHK